MGNMPKVVGFPGVVALAACPGFAALAAPVAAMRVDRQVTMAISPASAANHGLHLTAAAPYLAGRRITPGDVLEIFGPVLKATATVEAEPDGTLVLRLPLVQGSLALPLTEALHVRWPAIGATPDLPIG